MKTTKSPNAVAMVAYATAQRTLPPYLHLKSPKKFTQHQLVTCLVLKEFFTTDYRGIEEILRDSTDLKKILELKEVPHYTTLQKAAHRLTKKDTLGRLIKEILNVAVQSKILKKNVRLSAIDGTGFESRHISSYFVKRKAKGQDIYQMTTYTRYPKVGIVVDCDTHLVLFGVPSRGPFPDIVHFVVLGTATILFYFVCYNFNPFCACRACVKSIQDETSQPFHLPTYLFQTVNLFG